MPTEIIKPNPDCKACHGSGEVGGDKVPYGSTWATLPPDFCDCVFEQLQNEDAEIELDQSAYYAESDDPPFTAPSVAINSLDPDAIPMGDDDIAEYVSYSDADPGL